MLDNFLAGLKALSRDTGIYLTGTLKYVDTQAGDYIPAEQPYTSTDVIEVQAGAHACRDTTGNFIICHLERKPEPPREFVKGVAPQAMHDISEYRSPVTGEVIGSRSTHREHLRRHSLMEVGNERKALENKVKEMQAPERLSKEQVNRIYEQHS